MSLSVVKDDAMQVVFHASDLTVKCSQHASTYDRIMSNEDFTIVGTVTINHDKGDRKPGSLGPGGMAQKIFEKSILLPAK